MSASAYIFDYRGSNNNNRSYLKVKSSDGGLAWVTYTGSGTQHTDAVTSTTALHDNKWHHVACVFIGTGDATYSSGAKLIYLDGKLDALVEGSSPAMAYDQGTSMTLTLGRDASDDNEWFAGCIDEVRIWSDERTQAEIRSNMFSEVAVDSANLRHQYSFNEGPSTAIEDTATSTTGEAHLEVDLTLSDAGGWAGAGTFTYGTSTLVMAKSGTQTINYLQNEQINNLTINDGSTTQLFCLDESGGALRIYGNLVVHEKLKSHASSSSSQIKFKTADKTLTVGSDVKTTALSELFRIYNDTGGVFNFPELTTMRIFLNDGTSSATGDLTITEELQIDSGTTFNANGNTIALKDLDLNTGGTLDIRNSDMIFNVTSDGDDCHLGQGTLLTGNTTITGHSSATKTTLTARSDRGFEVVGDVKWLDLVNEDGELTVIGAVIDCSTSHSGARFIQWHHTLDTQQLLDADEAGDDDLRLTKPALDNSHELMTG